jgi:hypothetical protein
MNIIDDKCVFYLEMFRDGLYIKLSEELQKEDAAIYSGVLLLFGEV